MRGSFYISGIAIFCLTLSNCARQPGNEKIDRYSNGQIKRISRYRNGTLDGESLSFYEDGTLQKKQMFHDGIADGQMHTFHPSGALQSHRFWSRGHQIGIMVDYFNDTMGMISSTMMFNDDGKLVYRKIFGRHGEVLSVYGKKPER